MKRWLRSHRFFINPHRTFPQDRENDKRDRFYAKYAVENLVDCVCCNGTVTVLQSNCGKNFCQDSGDFLKGLWYTKIKISRKSRKMQRRKEEHAWKRKPILRSI